MVFHTPLIRSCFSIHTGKQHRPGSAAGVVSWWRTSKREMFHHPVAAPRREQSLKKMHLHTLYKLLTGEVRFGTTEAAA